MKLEELKKMIKEELDSFMQNENGVNEVDVDVDTDAGDVDADMGAEENGSEDILRQIYDMLKDKFEGEEDMEGEESEADMDEDMMEEAPKDDEDTMEEASAMGFGDPGNKKTSGANVGYTPAKTTKGDGKLHENKSSLQERFQKLANIVK